MTHPGIEPRSTGLLANTLASWPMSRIYVIVYNDMQLNIYVILCNCMYVIWLLSIYNSSLPIQDVALKTSREQWTIETGGERGSERSVLAARHDDEELLLCNCLYVCNNVCLG